MAVVASCNIVLCVHSGLELTDLTVVTDNQAMHDIAGWILGIVRFSYTLMYPVDGISSFRRSTARDVADFQTIWCPTHAFPSCVAAACRPSISSTEKPCQVTTV